MRRSLSLLAGLLVALTTTPVSAQQPERVWRHGLSLFGAVKYPPGFTRTDYVNPNAPKGGTARLSTDGTFDSFNVTLVRGSVAPIANYLYMPLFEDVMDEVSTAYGAIADAVSHPDDFSAVTYRIDPRAKWHDGRPITPEDVVWTMEQVKKHDPRMAFYYRNVVKVEQTGEREVTFTFDVPGNREKPLIIGQLNIMPKHWWTGTDAQGRQRDISQTTLEPPLGSGPYRIASVSPGRSITLERVRDWWAAGLPIYVGKHNFDEIRIEFFRDDFVELEAFKADQVDWRQENNARQWSTQYDFPAVRDNRVVRETFTNRASTGMQAIILNLRLPKFQDMRVRRALNLMLDFESMNATLMFNAYRRTDSFWVNTELASRDLPQGLELEILEKVRAQVPPEVFTTPYRNPVGGTQDALRNNLREALRLMREAGFEVRDRRMVHAATGEPFRLELLLNGPTFERHSLAFKSSLDRLGVELSLRQVDSAQYVNRVRERNFEAILGSYGQSLSPGNEQRDYWGSEAADRPASLNRAGIKNPAIDALINVLIYTKDRAELIAATRALDRVLLANHYMIPTWYSGRAWTARWDRFGRPDPMPDYGVTGFPTIWWFDQAKAARLTAR